MTTTPTKWINQFFGTWDIQNNPTREFGILVLTPEGRAVQFCRTSGPPRNNQVMRLWFCEEGDWRIRFRPSPEAKGWLRRIEVHEKGWAMIAPEQSDKSRFTCESASESLLPAWFQEELEKQLAMMIETEGEQ